MITRKKTISLFVVIIAVIIAAVFFVYLRPKPKAQAAHAALPIVTVTPVTYHTSEQTVKAFGTTTSPTSTVIRAQDSAEIAAIHFKPGQVVKKGQLLFRLRVSDVGNQEQKLKAQMLQSKSLYSRLRLMNQRDPGVVSNFHLLQVKLQY